VTRLVMFDVNGTLFPLGPIAERLAEIGLDGRLDLWFARVLRDGFAAAAAGTFAPFESLARHHLAVLLEAAGEPVTDDRLDRVVGGFSEVTAHDDVEPALRRLHDAGMTLVTLTNGSVEVTAAFLEREGLDGLVAASYDASQAGRWKPAPVAYSDVLERHDTEAGDAALVATHPWDVQGAVETGLTGVWVNREGKRYPEALAAPTIEVASFDEAAEQLLARTGKA
jgi:2-haloacid dehalogenase